MDIYEYFASKLGCCISDLRVERTLEWSRSLIKDPSSDAYTLDEWNSFVSYAVSEELHFPTREEAKEYLINIKVSK